MTKLVRSTPGKLTVEKSIHGMPSVQILENPVLAKRVADAVKDNYMHSAAYKAREGSGAFLQGFDPKTGWALVEFWLPNYQNFVDYLNTL